MSLALTIRRLNDQDKSGFWYFIAFVPFIGGIWLLVLTVMKGSGPTASGDRGRPADQCSNITLIGWQ